MAAWAPCPVFVAFSLSRADCEVPLYRLSGGVVVTATTESSDVLYVL